MDIWKIFEHFVENIWTIDRQCFSFTLCLLHSIEIEFMNGLCLDKICAIVGKYLEKSW